MDQLLGKSEWISIAVQQPELRLSEYSWPESAKVLVYTRHGRQQVAFRKQIDDGCPVRWSTDCSEQWDITNEVTHWMPLPSAPENRT